MKKTIYIGILFLVYLLLCGKSCVDESNTALIREKEVETEKESIRYAFETDWLNEEARYAQEMAAIQKMSDLADYMHVYTDNSIDSVFRIKAGEMIRDIFVSDEVLVSFDPREFGLNKKVNLRKFLDKGFDQEVVITKIGFDSIRVLAELQKTSKGTYEGKLACDQYSTYGSNSDTLNERHPVQVEIIVIQREKVFGPDTLKVWETFLGDMKIRK